MRPVGDFLPVVSKGSLLAQVEKESP